MDRVRQFFDDIGDGEWDRFDKDAPSRVALEVHRRFLRRHIPEGFVLEIGAGPGRFTIELAAMGCRVVVTDISPVRAPGERSPCGRPGFGRGSGRAPTA